jgi:hypothetical protein
LYCVSRGGVYDSTQVNKAIAQFKDSQLVYSLLGDRLYKTEGKNCATTAFIALEAGGIENLLRADQWLLSKRGILSPALLASYASKARDREHDVYPESTTLSDQLIPTKRDYINKVLTTYMKDLDPDYKPDNETSIPSKRGPSK